MAGALVGRSALLGRCTCLRRAGGTAPAVLTSALAAAVVACGSAAGGDTTARATTADAAWREGPRDSAGAIALACELLRDFPGALTAGSCHLEAYEDAPAEYVLRLRETPDRSSDRLSYSRSEVRLSKDGKSATLVRLPEP
jgi:hypothetical protein